MKKNLITHFAIATLAIAAFAFLLPQVSFAREAESGGVLEVEIGHGGNGGDDGQNHDINDDKGVHTTTSVSTSTSVKAGTNAGLRSAVDSLIAKFDGMDASKFCANISTAVGKLSEAERASLAWKADSYAKTLALGISANATAEEKAAYESLKSAYAKISASIAADAQISSSDKAAIRAAYLELMAEYRDGKIDDSRVAKVRGFIERASACLKDGKEVNAAVGASATASDDALKARYKTLVEENRNVKSVESDESKVHTVYKQRAKLFGFIPVWMNVHSEVRANGEAEVRYPWHSFLSRISGGKVTSETVLQNTGASTDNSFSAGEQEAAVKGTIKAFESVDSQ
ncbi:MAG TPA: hypothetical protein PK950_02780 [Candidatus Paceibacterota bacterium]|nr:hypothetical protein [Candidatus Paceibacterota bacterium]